MGKSQLTSFFFYLPTVNLTQYFSWIARKLINKNGKLLKGHYVVAKKNSETLFYECTQNQLLIKKGKIFTLIRTALINYPINFAF